MTQPKTLQIGEVWQRAWTIGEQTVNEQRVIVGRTSDDAVEWACWPFTYEQSITSSAEDWQTWQKQAVLVQPGLASAAEYSRRRPTTPGYYYILRLDTRKFATVKLTAKHLPVSFQLYGPRVTPTATAIKAQRRLG